MAKDRFQLADPTQGLELSPELQAAAAPKAGQSSGFLSSLLGLGGVVAGAIPSLKKSKQRGELQKQQQGQGAGAVAARQAGSAAARAAQGVASAGQGRSRGLQVREGLRSAERNVEAGARQAGVVGAQEAQAATAALVGLEQQRRATGLKLGSALGGGLGALGTTLTAAGDQGAPRAQDATGTPENPQLAAEGAQTLAEGQAGLENLTAARQEAGLPEPTAAPAAQSFDTTIQEGQQALDMVQGRTPTAPLQDSRGQVYRETVKRTLAEAQRALANRQHAQATAQGDAAGSPPPGDTSLEARNLDKVWEFLQNEIFDGRMDYDVGMQMWAEAQRRAGVQ